MQSHQADVLDSVCIASAFVLYELVSYPADTTQQPYHYAMFCVWGSVEVNIAVVSGKIHQSSSLPGYIY